MPLSRPTHLLSIAEAPSFLRFLVLILGFATVVCAEQRSFSKHFQRNFDVRLEAGAGPSTCSHDTPRKGLSCIKFLNSLRGGIVLSDLCHFVWPNVHGVLTRVSSWSQRAYTEPLVAHTQTRKPFNACIFVQPTSVHNFRGKSWLGFWNHDVDKPQKACYQSHRYAGRHINVIAEHNWAGEDMSRRSKKASKRERSETDIDDSSERSNGDAWSRDNREYKPPSTLRETWVHTYARTVVLFASRKACPRLDVLF